MTEQNFRNWYKREVQQIIDKLDTDRPSNVDSWFSQEDLQGLQEFPLAVATANLERNFDSVFRNARQRVCLDQWVYLN